MCTEYAGTILSKFAIVTSFDQNYIEYSKVMVKTLCENYHEDKELELYCLVPKNLMDMEADYINSIGKYKIKIKFIYSEKFDKADYFVERDQYTKNAWHRLFIGSLFPEIDKVLYLDPDMIFLRDASPLINYKTRGPMAAYIEDDFQSLCQEIYDNEDVVYFSDGVFIADLNYWREHDFESKMIEFAKTKNTRFVDQDAVNFVMHDIVEPLPVNFNFAADKAELYYTVTNPMIVHFSGPVKPWHHDMGGNKYALLWIKVFKSLTSQ